MGDKSKIEWCDATWNPVTGCTKVSEGCAHCYAERFLNRFNGVKGHRFSSGFTPHVHSGWAGYEPLMWKKPRRIFVCSLGDLFHEAVSDLRINILFDIMENCPQHMFMILTKRAERMMDTMRKISRQNGTPYKENPLSNVQIGVSIESQRQAWERIPKLLLTPAAFRFVSVEPMLEAVNLQEWINPFDLPCIDWVIVGGESGPGARRMDPKWALDLYEQTRGSTAMFFFKQAGEALAREWKCLDRKGGKPEEWPKEYAEMLVREMP